MTRDRTAATPLLLIPALTTALLGTALLISTAGCGLQGQSAQLEKAHLDWIAFAEAQPPGETAADREERAGRQEAEARRLLGDLRLTDLDGQAAYHAGSLLLAAGRPEEAAALLEKSLPDLGAHRNQALMVAAAARIKTGGPDLAEKHLMAVSDRSIAPAVTGSWGSVAFDLVEAYEEESRWSDALPLLELVRDGGDRQLAPVAARWIAYMHRDAHNEEAAAEAARDAMTRFPGDENLRTRMVNFIHQHGLVKQPLPQLPALTWIGGGDSAGLAGLLEGKVGLIDLWAPWCPPCRRSFPFLRELLERHGDAGLTVVGLTRLYGYYEDEKVRADDTPPEKELELIEAFAASHDLAWPVGVAADGEALFSTLGVAGIPNFILVDRTGTVRATFLGETAPVKRKIEDLAVKLLQQ